MPRRFSLPLHWLLIVLIAASGAWSGAVAHADDSQEALNKRAAELATRLKKLTREHGVHDSRVIDTQIELGYALLDLAAPKKALKILLPAEKRLSKRAREIVPRLVRLREAIARAHFDAGASEKGARFLEKKLPALREFLERELDNEDTRFLISACYGYGVSFHQLKEWTSALEMFRASNEVAVRFYGEGEIETTDSASAVGACLIELGKYEEARAILDPLLATLIEKHPTQKGLIQNIRSNLSVVERALGNDEVALATFEEELRALDEAGEPPGSDVRILAMQNRLWTLVKLARWEESIERAEELIDTLKPLRPKSRYKEALDDVKETRTECRKKLAEARKQEKDAGSKKEREKPEADERRTETSSPFKRSFRSKALSERTATSRATCPRCC